MFKNLTIQAQLIFAIGFLLVILIFVGTLGVIGMKQSDDVLESLYTRNTIPMKQLADVQKLTLRDRQRILLMLLSPTPANIQRHLAEIESSLIEANRLLDSYRVDDMNGETAVYKKLVEDRKRLLEVGMLPTMAALRGGNVEEATQIAGEKLRRLYNPVADGIETIMDSKLQAIKLELDQTKSRHLLILNLSIAATLIGLLLSTATGFFLIRTILRQLGGEPSVAAKVAGRIAEGDFTGAIETRENDKSSLLFAMKHMSKGLTNIVNDVRGATDSISVSAKQIATGNADLSSRAEDHAASLEETASSMQQLTSTVKQNAENAKQANQLAATASDVAVKGGQVVGQVVQTMSSIRDSSNKIVDIISVIEGIAFQTNILALNAAVEAARAGEQGRGFAVVAGEVRNLAQRSAAAAKEIQTLIGDSVDKVDAGAKLVGQAGTTMNEIVNAVKRVSDIMSGIAAASAEQSAGIEQVNQAITQMDEMVQGNSALVEEATAAAESMHDQSLVLMQAVSIFKLKAVSTGQTGAAELATIAFSSSRPRRAVSSAAGAPVKKIPKLTKVADGTEEWKEF